MRIDRFLKVLLVTIALLLAINCFTGIRTPLTDSVANADAAPSFIQVGKVYVINDGQYRIKILKIGTSGWVYVENQTARVTRWENTNQISSLTEQ